MAMWGKRVEQVGIFLSEKVMDHMSPSDLMG
jgi:hypothetical protein